MNDLCLRKSTILPTIQTEIGLQAAKFSKDGMTTRVPNMKEIRSAWRRVKNDIKDAIIRDLNPVRDVKGGGGAAPRPRGPTRPGS